MSGKNLVLQLLCKMLSTNQSTVFFDYEYLWKKSPNTLDILHGDNHQGKVGSKATTLVGCGPLFLSPKKIARFLDHQVLEIVISGR